MFRLLKNSRHFTQWTMLLIAMTTVTVAAISGQGGVYPAISVAFVAVGVWLVDGFVEALLRRQFKRVFGASPYDYYLMGSKYPPRYSPEVQLTLQGLAQAFESAERSEIFFRRVIDPGLALSCSLRLLAQKQKALEVVQAKRRFWQAHRLALIFDFIVKPRWKDYLPTQAA